MKLKTRLLLTGIIVILLPMLLTVMAFFGTAMYMTGTDKREDIEILQDDESNSVRMAREVFARIATDIQKDPHVLENREYLRLLNKEAQIHSGYVLVRKQNEIYYTGDPAQGESIFLTLPKYGVVQLEGDAFLYAVNHKLLRQMDFRFADGSEGTFFLIISVGTMLSHDFLVQMILIVLFVLLATSALLMMWIRAGFTRPIDELSDAMQKVKDGNFDYRLDPDKQRGEFGDLYRSYEDMRLRLKESADEKLEHEHQNKELITNISHDLKTPITAIQGYAQGLIDGVASSPEKQMKYLQTIYNKSVDMTNLINELTLYSSIDNNRIPYHFSKINVQGYFGDCVDEVGIDLENRGIQLNYSNLCEPDTTVVADPEQLKRVINNIIGNSVKYMDRDDGCGMIDIRILDEVDAIRVEIEDNGKGIPAKDLPNIFDRFYRADASRNSKHSGSGIGLSIVRKIVEDHGGYIWVTSREGEGTCMHFVIKKYRDTKVETEEVASHE